jgi:hypothetical protein
MGMNGSEKIKGEGVRRGHQGAASLHVDVWLRDTLASTYNTVLSEPLPDSWVRLIRCAKPGERES